MPFSLAIAEAIKAYNATNNKVMKDVLDELIKKQEKFYMEVYSRQSHRIGSPSMTGFDSQVAPVPHQDIRPAYTQPNYSVNKG